MSNAFDRPSRAALWLNMAAAVGLALACNGLVFGLGWNQTAVRDTPAYAPPGYVVGIVWTLLFAAMGAARWLALSVGTTARSAALRSRHARLIVWLILFCAAYTFYGLAPESRIPGFVGNLVTIPFSVWIAWTVRASSRRAALLVGLVPLWVIYATIAFGPSMLAAG
jgi:tryptophan-rich sensory protein